MLRGPRLGSGRTESLELLSWTEMNVQGQRLLTNALATMYMCSALRLSYSMAESRAASQA